MQCSEFRPDTGLIITVPKQLMKHHFDDQRLCLHIDALNTDCNYRSWETGVIPQALSKVADRKQAEALSFTGEYSLAEGLKR